MQVDCEFIIFNKSFLLDFKASVLKVVSFNEPVF